MVRSQIRATHTRLDVPERGQGFQGHRRSAPRCPAGAAHRLRGDRPAVTRNQRLHASRRNDLRGHGSHPSARTPRTRWPAFSATSCRTRSTVIRSPCSPAVSAWRLSSARSDGRAGRCDSRQRGRDRWWTCTTAGKRKTGRTRSRSRSWRAPGSRRRVFGDALERIEKSDPKEPGLLKYLDPHSPIDERIARARELARGPSRSHRARSPSTGTRWSRHFPGDDEQARRDREAALLPFHPLIRRWFRDSVGTPTEVQARAWPVIARRRARAGLRAHGNREDIRRVSLGHQPAGHRLAADRARSASSTSPR